MRPVSDRWAATIASSHAIETSVFASLGDELLTMVPIIGGTITYDVTARGRRRCQIAVPLRAEGRTWDPGSDPAHPLAAYGQRLHISTGVKHPGGATESLDQGRFLITSTRTDEVEGVVTVTGSDLMQLMQECRVVGNPWGGFGINTTYQEVIDHLSYVGLKNWWVEDPQILFYSFAPGMVDRNIGAPMDIPERTDRMEPLETLCAAWPADMSVNDSGYLEFRPPVTKPAAQAVARIAGEATGTLITRGRTQARQRVYNDVIARGTDPATGEQRALGIANKATGPLSIFGPYGWITRWYDSPLLTTNAQAQKTAQTLLARGLLYALTEEVTAVPNPALELNDTVDVVTATGGTFRGLISSITLPLSASGGPMTLTVTTETGDT
ncbi:hypothetical protein [Streptomyces sp. NPDC059247]|uniref:hypothetical protein n=1 Tax=Streptomyces sp. NPDC059247 TaxID=3346790 RepID=UPI0036C9896F